MWPSEEEERNGCTCHGIFNFRSATPPVWTSATQTARKQEALCAVWGSGVGKGDERWKVSLVMQRMQSNSRIPAIPLSKETFFPVVTQCPGSRSKVCIQQSWDRQEKQWEPERQHFSLESIPHLNQNSPASQSKTLPEPEILSESTQELLPPVNACQ